MQQEENTNLRLRQGYKSCTNLARGPLGSSNSCAGYRESTDAVPIRQQQVPIESRKTNPPVRNISSLLQ